MVHCSFGGLDRRARYTSSLGVGAHCICARAGTGGIAAATGGYIIRPYGCGAMFRRTRRGAHRASARAARPRCFRRGGVYPRPRVDRRSTPTEPVRSAIPGWESPGCGRMWASAPTNKPATRCVGVDALIDPTAQRPTTTPAGRSEIDPYFSRMGIPQNTRSTRVAFAARSHKSLPVRSRQARSS